MSSHLVEMSNARDEGSGGVGSRQFCLHLLRVGSPTPTLQHQLYYAAQDGVWAPLQGAAADE